MEQDVILICQFFDLVNRRICKYHRKIEKAFEYVKSLNETPTEDEPYEDIRDELEKSIDDAVMNFIETNMTCHDSGTPYKEVYVAKNDLLRERSYSQDTIEFLYTFAQTVIKSKIKNERIVMNNKALMESYNNIANSFFQLSQDLDRPSHSIKENLNRAATIKAAFYNSELPADIDAIWYLDELSDISNNISLYSLFFKDLRKF